MLQEGFPTEGSGVGVPPVEAPGVLPTEATGVAKDAEGREGDKPLALACAYRTTLELRL